MVRTNPVLTADGHLVMYSATWGSIRGLAGASGVDMVTPGCEFGIGEDVGGGGAVVVRKHPPVHRNAWWRMMLRQVDTGDGMPRWRGEHNARVDRQTNHIAIVYTNCKHQTCKIVVENTTIGIVLAKALAGLKQDDPRCFPLPCKQRKGDLEDRVATAVVCLRQQCRLAQEKNCFGTVVGTRPVTFHSLGAGGKTGTQRHHSPQQGGCLLLQSLFASRCLFINPTRPKSCPQRCQHLLHLHTLLGLL